MGPYQMRCRSSGFSIQGPAGGRGFQIDEGPCPMSGVLIAFEGLDCAGKSLLLRKLPKLLSGMTRRIVICGEYQSPFARLFRGSRLKTTSPFLKTYLFAVDRAWTYEKRCMPSLERNRIVLWDRYVDSALTYRSVEFSAKSDRGLWNLVRAINRPFRRPDLTFYISISPETSMRRARKSHRSQPYSLGFLRSVAAEYRALARRCRYVTIDGNKCISEVVSEVALIIRERFGGRKHATPH